MQVFPAVSAKGDTVESIALRHSGRGMTALRPSLPADYCLRAAKALLSRRRGTVLLTTGFCVGGAAETDGPPGTLCLAKALRPLGFAPVVVTDGICRGIFETEGIPVCYASAGDGDAFYQRLLEDYAPSALISIERCGRDAGNDYRNMRGESIAPWTAPIDTMFQLARQRDILTIGIGDGGNEIGMGNVRGAILDHLSIRPCTVTVDNLIIATTSNWGAYALVCALGRVAGACLLPDFGEMRDYLCRLADRGCVDGVTGRPTATVDGFSQEIEEEVYTALYQWERAV